MLIVEYKPSCNEYAVADCNAKATAENFLYLVSLHERKEVVISQALMIDAIRAVLVEKNIDPSLVVFHMYSADGEFIEYVSITDHYALTSWESTPEIQFDLLKTICAAPKYKET